MAIIQNKDIWGSIEVEGGVDEELEALTMPQRAAVERVKEIAPDAYDVDRGLMLTTFGGASSSGTFLYFGDKIECIVGSRTPSIDGSPEYFLDLRCEDSETVRLRFERSELAKEVFQKIQSERSKTSG